MQQNRTVEYSLEIPPDFLAEYRSLIEMWLTDQGDHKLTIATQSGDVNLMRVDLMPFDQAPPSAVGKMMVYFASDMDRMFAEESVGIKRRAEREDVTYEGLIIALGALLLVGSLVLCVVGSL